MTKKVLLSSRREIIRRPMSQQLVPFQPAASSRSAKPAVVKAKSKRKPRNRNRQQLSLKSDLSQSTMVSAPVAKGRIRRMAQPKFLSVTQMGDIIVQHREYITDLNGSTTFVANPFSLNPGLASTFPWLSPIALRFESYRFEMLRLCFETEASTTATGTIMLGVDFDSTDNVPFNKTQIMSYRSSVRSPPWQDCCCQLTREDLSKRTSYFVRNSSVPAGSDIKLYDVGTWYAASQAQAGATLVGELYIEYRIKLMTPQMGNPTYGLALGGELGGLSNATPFSIQTAFTVPVTYISTGTTTSVTTFTFIQPWAGFLAFNIIGTGIGTVSTVGSTATINPLYGGVQNTTTLNISGYEVSAQIGQTVVFTIPNTTITGGSAFWGQANVLNN